MAAVGDDASVVDDGRQDGEMTTRGESSVSRAAAAAAIESDAVIVVAPAEKPEDDDREVSIGDCAATDDDGLMADDTTQPDSLSLPAGNSQQHNIL